MIETIELALPKGYKLDKGEQPRAPRLSETYLILGSDGCLKPLKSKQEFISTSHYIVEKKVSTGEDLIGCLCYVSDYSAEHARINKYLAAVITYEGQLYKAASGVSWKHATPLTPSEIEVFLKKAKELTI